MHSMTPNEPCADWQDAISAYLDGELPPMEEQQVHAHLRQCQACAEALVALVPLVQALRNAPMAEPTRDLWPRIHAELRHAPVFWSRKLRPRTLRQLGWATAAAVLVLAGGVTVVAHQTPQQARIADVDTYWHEHALFSQDQGVPGLYAPSLHAVQSSYDLDP